MTLSQSREQSPDISFWPASTHAWPHEQADTQKELMILTLNFNPKYSTSIFNINFNILGTKWKYTHNSWCCIVSSVVTGRTRGAARGWMTSQMSHFPHEIRYRRLDFRVERPCMTTLFIYVVLDAEDWTQDLMCSKPVLFHFAAFLAHCVLNNEHWEFGKMAQWLRALTFLTEDLGPLPSSHSRWQTLVIPVPGIWCLLLTLEKPGTHTVPIHTCKQYNRTIKQNK